MKHLLLTTLLTGAALTASAAVAPPDVLYLVGTMTDWQTPADGGTQYQLLPTGDSGLVYSGSFDFSDLDILEFRVFTAICGWDDEYNLGVQSNINSFKDIPDTLPLGTNNNNYWNAVTIRNWRPGKLDVTVTLQETDGKFISGEITLVSSTQPDFRKVPAAVYIVGEFNDYKLPTADNTNGAIAMPLFSGDEGVMPEYYIETELPAGKAKFMYYYVDPETGNAMYVNGPAEPILMEAPAENVPPVYAINSQALPLNNEMYFDISNFTGGKMAFYYNLFESHVQFSWYEAPLSELMSTTLYMVLETEEGKRLIEGQSQTYFMLDTFSKVKSLFFTSEKSVEPSAESIWGVAEDLTQSSKFERYTIVKGGKPLQLDLGGEATLVVMLNKYNHTFDVNADVRIDMSTLEQIYIIGYMNNWISPNTYNEEELENYALKKVEPGVFQGTILCPANTDYAGFRFYCALTGWDGGASLGATLEDFSDPTPVEFMKEMSIYMSNGKGNWILPDWSEAANVTFTVNTNDGTLIVKKEGDSGVAAIEAEDSEAVYYTLQGVRVANPANGIYLKVTPKSTEKVYLK